MQLLIDIWGMYITQQQLKQKKITACHHKWLCISDVDMITDGTMNQHMMRLLLFSWIRMENPQDRDIAVHPKNEPPRNIAYTSPNADPMTYPLLFPYGELGWRPGLEHCEERRTNKRNTISLLQFYAYRLAVRQTVSPIFHSGKLFQQYIVDAYVRTEAARLHYIRQNQSNLRVELYQGLLDHVNTRAEELNLAPGKIVILPSSFQGSPRAMQQNFQDAMAIVSKYGRPDIFLTFTCNPKNSDIVENLLENERRISQI